ncbi:hypothetical protein DLAC_11706 [Tieghemostelium lacteum]|uniref:VPS37 C-terminal domain-containing protein n=1 Tax=Tieghemostelium lacteum TaxID=361077 RepID=A0A151ZB20_TIELA|nr:hypothetical protein DLAC_11706 [Tieghemostelium lacteum]|eukprot:KYQ91131.1 hypothetical protein DLAC_11706 [Tieghemostelium lacteum]
MSADMAMKMKQIAGLKSRFSNTQEIAKDSTFKITLTDKLSLFISLPVNFPNSGPSYFIEGYGNHIDIPSPGGPWTKHSSLSNLTLEIFQQIKNNTQLLIDYESRLKSINVTNSPPPPYAVSKISPTNSQTNINSSGGMKPMDIGSSGGKSTQQPPPPYKDQTAASKPYTIPGSFPDLKNKSKEELEELLTNEDMIKAYLFSFDEVSTLSAEKESHLENSEILTTATDALQKQIDEQKKKLDDQNKMYTELNQEYQKLKDKKESYDKLNSIPILLDKLSDLISNSEMESDSISQSFLDGSIDLKEFKKKFKEVRTLYHSRQGIKEKHMQILHNGHQ